jgi:arginine/ornithine N-succinyltransferase beta subunit
MMDHYDDGDMRTGELSQTARALLLLVKENLMYREAIDLIEKGCALHPGEREDIEMVIMAVRVQLANIDMFATSCLHE